MLHMCVNRQISSNISDIFPVQQTLNEDKHPQVWRWDHCFFCDTGIRLENGQHIFSWARNCLQSSKWATHTHILPPGKKVTTHIASRALNGQRIHNRWRGRYTTLIAFWWVFSSIYLTLVIWVIVFRCKCERPICFNILSSPKRKSLLQGVKPPRKDSP